MRRIGATPEMRSLFVRSITQDHEGGIWVGGTTLLRFQANSGWREFPLEGGPSKNLVTAVLETSDGVLWVGTRSGLFRLRGSGLERVHGISDTVTALRETGDGSLFAGTIGQGLFLFRQGAMLHLSAPDFLPSNTVHTVFQDTERNVWLGTQSGMLRLSKTPVTIIPFPGGADSDFETIYQDFDGSVWVPASNHLFRIQDGQARPFEFPGRRA